MVGLGKGTLLILPLLNLARSASVPPPPGFPHPHKGHLVYMVLPSQTLHVGSIWPGALVKGSPQPSGWALSVGATGQGPGAGAQSRRLAFPPSPLSLSSLSAQWGSVTSWCPVLSYPSHPCTCQIQWPWKRPLRHSPSCPSLSGFLRSGCQKWGWRTSLHPCVSRSFSHPRELRGNHASVGS